MIWLLAFPLISFALDSLIVQGGGNGNNWPNIIVENQLNTEDAVLRTLEQWDVVEVMKLTGHDDGLDEQRTIQIFGEDGLRVVTEGDKLRLKKAGRSFIDVTDHPELGALNSQRIRSNILAQGVLMTKDVSPREAVAAMFREVDDTHLRKDIAKLTSFWNRNYRSPWGLASSNWVHDKVKDLLDSTAHSATTTSVRRFKHKFIQNSVIASLDSTDDSTKLIDKELIILGAHQDSLNYRLPFHRAPGADDDGSGTVTVLQVLRSLMVHKFVPPTGIRLEFHWYAAEEGGLLGSQDIAAAYEKDGVNVRGMLQMDMTAFLKNGTKPIVGFFQDMVDKNLTTFATKLVDAYLPLSWNMTTCGKTCGSDHMSWTKAGYRSAFAMEGMFEDSNNFIHTAYDDTDAEGQYSFDHMLEFVKLGIAFVTELSIIPRVD